MKMMSDNFNEKVAAAEKSYDPVVQIAWEREIKDDRGFFTLDYSTLDGGDILWSGNQDTVSFMDRYTYTNETHYMQNFKISRMVSNKPYGLIQGTANITLNNGSGRFEPNNDPDIGQYVHLPNRPVRIQIGIDGEYLNLFTGYLSRPKTGVTRIGNDFEANAFDACSYFANCSTNLDAQVGKTLDEIIAALLIEAGFGVDQFQLEPSVQGVIGYFPKQNDAKVSDIITKLCESEWYLIFADGDGIIHGWNANHFVIEDSDQPVWNVSYSNAPNIGQASTNILNDIQVIAKPHLPVGKSKLWSLTSASDNTLVPAGGSIDIFADLKDAENAVVYAMELGTPVFTTNTKQDGSGNTNNSAISLSSMYNFGPSVRMTFRNSSNTPTYITAINLGGTSAQQNNISSTRARDQASIDEYGANPDASTPGRIYELENEYIQSASFATTIATLIANNYASPLGKYNVGIFPVPMLEIGDYTNTYIESSDETKPTMVFGIEFSGGVDKNFKQNIYTEEREIQRFFTLDRDELDGPAVLAF